MAISYTFSNLFVSGVTPEIQSEFSTQSGGIIIRSDLSDAANRGLAQLGGLDYSEP
jgi:hypothetical protein